MANGLTYQRTTTTPEATKQLAATLAPYLHAGDTIVLTGDLGAGKTQFVQGVAAALGVRAAVTSPTFNILLEYHDGRLPLYHYDLYRLDARWQLEDIDYYSAIDGDGDGAAFVEWAEKFPEEYKKQVMLNPMHRFGDPEDDIAPVVAFLAGPDSC